jgi:hypothetical protein
MRVAFLLLCAVVSVVVNAGDQRVSPESGDSASGPMIYELSGSWLLQIRNERHQVVTSMTIRFADEAVESCMGGNWRRVVVTDYTSSDEKFFPATEPLSYERTNNHIVIGRNEICDAYLHLKGKVRGTSASGEYVTFGFGGGKRLGYFSMTRRQ